MFYVVSPFFIVLKTQLRQSGIFQSIDDMVMQVYEPGPLETGGTGGQGQLWSIQ